MGSVCRGNTRSDGQHGNSSSSQGSDQESQAPGDPERPAQRGCGARRAALQYLRAILGPFAALPGSCPGWGRRIPVPAMLLPGHRAGSGTLPAGHFRANPISVGLTGARGWPQGAALPAARTGVGALRRRTFALAFLGPPAPSSFCAHLWWATRARRPGAGRRRFQKPAAATW